MEQPLVAARLAPFGTTIFTEMTKLAQQHGCVNLSQGFPDFDGPEFIKAAAVKAMGLGGEGDNQYARMLGLPALNRAIAARWKRCAGIAVDPDAQVQVTSGCTEAIAATMLGLINPGDEVILFEPFYDSYRACVAMAGGTPRFVTLKASGADGTRAGFAFDFDELRCAFTARTRAIIVNTPHNPTGKVFTREELGQIASLCSEKGVLAITDEVYERLVFEPGEGERPHLHLAAFPRMAERTVTLSSLGKTYSLTGWKIGWAIGPARMIAGVRAAHQFLTFATATPLQHAAVVALTEGEAYVAELVETYRQRRDFLATALRSIGFGVYPTEGTYFIMADHSAFGFPDDVAFCRHLAEKVGVAAIPPSVFYNDPTRGGGRALVRFAFCKRHETLERAVDRLGKLGKRRG